MASLASECWVTRALSLVRWLALALASSELPFAMEEQHSQGDDVAILGAIELSELDGLT